MSAPLLCVSIDWSLPTGIGWLDGPSLDGFEAAMTGTQGWDFP